MGGGGDPQGVEEFPHPCFYLVAHGMDVCLGADVFGDVPGFHVVTNVGVVIEDNDFVDIAQGVRVEVLGFEVVGRDATLVENFNH